MSIESEIINPIIDAVTNWLRTGFNDLLRAAEAVIHWIDVKMAEAKFYFAQWIRGFYNTNVGFWVILLSIVGVVALAAWLGPKIAAFVASPAFTDWMSSFNKGLASIANVLHLNTFVEINRMAQVLFPQWRKLWTGIYQDVGNIAGDIGFGLGTIAAMLTAGKALLVTWNSALGLQQDQADTVALMEVSQYIQNLSNNFDTYANDPQQIWNDFYDRVVLKYSTRIQSTIGGIVAAIPNIESKIKDFEKIPSEFFAFQKAYETRLNIHPPVDVQTYETGIKNTVKIINDKINNTIINPLNRVIASIQPLITAQEQHAAEIQANRQYSGQNAANIKKLSGVTSLSAYIEQPQQSFEKQLTSKNNELRSSNYDTWWQTQLYAAQVDMEILTIDEVPDMYRSIVADSLGISTSPVVTPGPVL